MTAAQPDPRPSPEACSGVPSPSSLVSLRPPTHSLVIAREILALADPGERSASDFVHSPSRRLGRMHDDPACQHAALFASIASSDHELARLRVARAPFLQDGGPIAVRVARIAVTADAPEHAGIRLLDLRDDPDASLFALHQHGQTPGSDVWTRLRELLGHESLVGVLVTDPCGATAVVINLQALTALLSADLVAITVYEKTYELNEVLRPSELLRLQRLNRWLAILVREFAVTSGLLSDLAPILRRLVYPGVALVATIAAAIRIFG